MHFWLVEHHIKHWHFQCCYNQCAPTKGWFAKTKIVFADKNQGTYIPQILFISILKPEPQFFQTTTESINMHYETCTKLAQELSNLWTTYSALLAEEHQILTEQHQTSIIHCHEDIEHTEIVQTSFNFFEVSISFSTFKKRFQHWYYLQQAKSTSISTATTIIAEVEPDLDHHLLIQCLDVKAKIMVIIYFTYFYHVIFINLYL